MANLKNWHPDGEAWWQGEEHRWFDKAPKAVLFEIARQFAMRLADNFTPEAGFALMKEEWRVLHSQGIVPQKPPSPEGK